MESATRSSLEMDQFYGVLEILLWDILSVIKPVEADVRTRYQVIEDLRSVVTTVDGMRGATVEPFGSFISNLYTNCGDLDISIEIPNGSLLSSVSKKQKQSLLGDLARALRMKGVVRKLQFISKARVPLLIFESPSQISCDISVCNFLGQTKSRIFLWITEIDERFRDMVLLVKEWAKSKDINNPKTGTLNSYSLSLLVIFHFQTCEPPIFPPLQEIYAGNLAHDLTGERVSIERSIQETCATNIARFRANNMRYSNKSTLAELYIQFFKKFSVINEVALEYGICSYTGQWELLTSNGKWMTKRYSLIIEDPFERPDNAARAVGKNQLIMISEAFQETYNKLSGNQNQSSVITNSLVRPQTRSKLSARSRGNPNPHIRDFRNHSHTSNRDHSFQRQYQSMALESHPSRSIFRQRQQLPQPRPVYNGLHTMRLDSFPSPSLPQGHQFSSAVHPIQNRNENRRMDPSEKVFPRRSGAGQSQQVWRPRQSDR